MNPRFYLLLSTLLIGACAMAQEDTADVRLIPDPDSEVIIDAATESEPDSTSILMVVEEMPEFPGGMPALFAYLAQQISYPEKARKKDIEGRVFIQFVVEKDGAISNPHVLRGIGGGCDEEALRAVQHMPTWKPGQQGGKPVRVKFTLPVRFKLTD